MKFTAVDLSQEVTLPDPWMTLLSRGFHPDLALRAKAFLLHSRVKNFEEEAWEFLDRLGEGFLNPFRSSDIEIALDDPDREYKMQALAALQELSDEFGDRISAIVWQTYPFLATRPSPGKYATILSAKPYLPFPWWLADTVLHGMGKVYGLMMHIQSHMFLRTGRIFEHNCDCGCDVHGGGSDFIVQASLLRSRYDMATAALFSHLCGDSALIMFLEMPFAMGLSPEAAQVMAE